MKRALLLSASLALTTACSPAFDWREFVPEGSDLNVSFPCRPDRQTRRVDLAGARVQMDLLTCATGGSTFALGFVELDDPGRISPVLVAMRSSALGNIGGHETNVAPVRIAGMSANDASVKLSLDGTLPDGATIKEHVAFFTRGLRVYQASVIGANPAAASLETFFDGLRFPA